MTHKMRKFSCSEVKGDISTEQQFLGQGVTC